MIKRGFRLWLKLHTDRAGKIQLLSEAVDEETLHLQLFGVFPGRFNETSQQFMVGIHCHPPTCVQKVRKAAPPSFPGSATCPAIVISGSECFHLPGQTVSKGRHFGPTQHRALKLYEFDISSLESGSGSRPKCHGES